MSLSPAIRAKISIACLRESPSDLDTLDNLVESGAVKLKAIEKVADLYRSTLVKNFIKEKRKSTYISPVADLADQLRYLYSLESPYYSSSDDSEFSEFSDASDYY